MENMTSVFWGHFGKQGSVHISICICIRQRAHHGAQSHTHLAIRSFSQHSKKLKAVRSNPLTVSVDTFTGQLHLLCLNTGVSMTQKSTVLV